jgi:hypothetical protein
MSHHDDHLGDTEFGPVIDRLQAERPTASDLELGLIKQRVRGRVGRTAQRSGRTEFMRSRLAILGTLVLGMVLTTGGASLAVSGFASQSDNAAVSQYGTPTPTPTGGGDDDGQTLGEEESGGPAGGQGGGGPAGAGDDQGVGGEQDDGGVQPARQVEAGAQAGGDDGEQLPFTGFAAIPILLGGVALLSTGLVLRRRAGDDLT